MTSRRLPVLLRRSFAARTHGLAVVLLALTASAAASQSAPATGTAVGAADGSRTVAITHVTVLPMDREHLLSDQTVLVRGDRIVSVGPARSVSVPAGAQRIDGRGRFLIPGLTDAHVHYIEEHRIPRGADDAIRREFARLSIEAGVTTALNLCGADRSTAFRDSIARRLVLGPRLIVSPPCLDDSTMTAAQGLAVATAAKAKGFDFLKVYSHLSAAGFLGASGAARRLDLPVLGHIPWRVGLQPMLDAGVVDIAHAEEFLYNAPFHLPSYTEADSAVDLDRRHIPEVVHAMRAAGAAVTTTLIAYRTIIDQAEDLDAVLRRPALAAVSAAARTERGWEAKDNERARRLSTPVALARLRAAYAVQQSLVRSFQDSGVTVLAGTDAGGDIPMVPGWALHDELALLTDAGLTPYQALRAATASAGAFLSAHFHQPPSGTVTPGARADLVLLDANPLVDIHNTRRIRGVVLRGRWLPGPATGKP